MKVQNKQENILCISIKNGNESENFNRFEKKIVRVFENCKINNNNKRNGVNVAFECQLKW